MFSRRMVSPAASAWPPKPSRYSEQALRALYRLKPPKLRHEPLPRSPSQQIMIVGRWNSSLRREAAMPITP